MGLEKKLAKLDRRVERFKALKFDSLRNIAEKTWDFLYILNIGGSLMRRYQKPLAEKLGWEEKDSTIRNAVYCGILPALGYVILNQHEGGRLGESFQEKFYLYPAFMFTQAIFRAFYSQITKMAIGSFSVYNAVGSSVYAMNEENGKEKQACGGI